MNAAKDWLVYARKFRIDDGTARAQLPVNKLDYAVIRLAKSIGDRPSRMSGGPIRGWLTLPAEPCDYLEPRRVVVFQHPGGAAQQMDVGQFVQLDPSATRAWYRVSTAKGSSGGAAVSANGELFALHNAEVESPPGPLATGAGRTRQPGHSNRHYCPGPCRACTRLAAVEGGGQPSGRRLVPY